MIRVGITGGMGSGKSLVAQLFSLLGISVYNADVEARKLMETHPEIKKGVLGLFGNGAYEGGKLNRSLIAELAFSNPAILTQLNSLVHPFVIKEGEDWMSLQNGPYALKEAALLFESGSHKKLDFVIGVWSPKKLRIARILKRDKITRQMAEARIARQMNEKEKMKLCQFVIRNDEQHALIPQVLALHTTFLDHTLLSLKQ